MTHLLFLLRSADEQLQLQQGRYLLTRDNGPRVLQSLNDEAVFFRGSERAEERYCAAARLRTLRALDDGEHFWLEVEGLYLLEPLPMNSHIKGQYIELTDDEFSALLAQPNAVAPYGIEDYPATYVGPADIDPEPELSAPTMETLKAVITSARQQMNFTCMLTGRRLPPDELRVVILRPTTAGGILHVNNCLVFSGQYDEAFGALHFTVRRDFSIVIDAQKMSPALRNGINPTGRLLVPDNEALRPHPDNLAYHNRLFLGIS